MARHSSTIAGLTSEITAQLKFAKDPNILVFTPLGGLGPIDIITLNVKTGEYKAYDVKSKNTRKTDSMPKDGYKRNAHIPMSGFTAGPCLLKDTMQLSSFFNKKFSLGHSAMDVNEGMPKFIYEDLKKNINLKNKKIGLLGLAFKADCDDTRDSLAIKLLNFLKKKKLKTFYTDEFYKPKGSISKQELIKRSDIIIISCPHTSYKKIKFPKNKIVIDIWGFRN